VTTFHKTLDTKIKALEKEWGEVFDVGDFLRGIDFCKDLIVSHMEQWCSINAYDSERGKVEPEDIGVSRGVVCPANELLETVKLLVRK